MSSQEWVHSICDMCTCGCGIRVLKVDGVPVKIEGDPDNPHNRGKLCAKGNSGLMRLYDPMRIKTPLRRTNPEKGIGVDPKWVETTWDEALDIVTEKLKKIRADNPKKLVVITFDQILESNFTPAWLRAFGTPNFLVGSAGYFCGNGVHPINYIVSGAWYVDPDLEYCNYYLMIGSQLGFIVGYNTMPITGSMAEARRRGMKLVVVDPICTTAAAKADEWIPIRPGTDGAFALGLLNVMLNELNRYDVEFIKFYTNGPYLIGPDGRYVRDTSSGKPLVWDEASSSAKPFNDPSVKDPALEGSYEVNGVSCYPSFYQLKNHLKDSYTPEKVSEITTVKPSTIRRIAHEFVDAARIGETITIEGKQLPYRPATTYYDRGTSGHRHGFLSCWSIMLLNIVTGNLDAVGGTLTPNGAGPWWTPKPDKDGLLVPSDFSSSWLKPYPPRPVTKPESLDLLELFPIGVYAQTPLFLVAQEPQKFQISYSPEMLIHWNSNYLHTSADVNVVMKFIRKIPFVLSFGSRLEESLMMADIVLPSGTYLERFVYPNSSKFIRNRPDLASYYWNFMLPVTKPMYQSREVAMVLLELARRAGFIGEFYKQFNRNLSDSYKLDPDKFYEWEEICDRWIKSYAGPDKGVEYAKKKGFIDFGSRKVEHAYWRRLTRNVRVPVYLEYVPPTGREVEQVTSELGIRWDVSDYQALPDWKPCPAYNESREGFDLYVTNFKSEVQMVSHTDDVVWLSKLSERSPTGYTVLINSETAKGKGLKDGQKVSLEAPNGAILDGTLKTTNAIHTETLGVAGSSGHWSSGMPRAKGKGTHFNALLSYDFEHIDPVVASVDMCVKVKLHETQSV